MLGALQRGPGLQLEASTSPVARAPAPLGQGARRTPLPLSFSFREDSFHLRRVCVVAGPRRPGAPRAVGIGRRAVGGTVGQAEEEDDGKSRAGDNEDAPLSLADRARRRKLQRAEQPSPPPPYGPPHQQQVALQASKRTRGRPPSRPVSALGSPALSVIESAAAAGEAASQVLPAVPQPEAQGEAPATAAAAKPPSTWTLGRSTSSSDGGSSSRGRSNGGPAARPSSSGVVVARAAAAEPLHPRVTFRTAAELRKMLQERAAQQTSTAVQPGPDTAAGLEPSRAGSTQAGNPSTSSSSNSGGSRDRLQASASAPPRRFFALSGPTGGAASTSSGGGAAPPSSGPQRTNARVTHLPWRTVGGEGEAGAAVTVDPREHDKEYQKAKTYSLGLLKRTPLAAGDLRRRLLERGYAAETAAALVGWLTEVGALNDAIFARLYVRGKWVGNLSAPTKIQKELVAQGVAAEHISAALAYVFGPSRRIKLTGHGTVEETEVREALLEAARKHVEQRRGSSSNSMASAPGPNGRGGSSSSSDYERAVEAAKERDGKRRRLGMWLQYRGHDMDLVFKVFGLLRI